MAAGEKVVVTLPGAVLPGDFKIEPRKTYGHISNGMCASERELGLGDNHDGIILLRKYGFTPEEYEKLQPGDDAMHLLHLDQPLLEINITPDRGYAFSYRGVAREYHHSTGAVYTDPATALGKKAPVTQGLPEGVKSDIEVIVDDKNPIHGVVGCDRYYARAVRGFDPASHTPNWMRRRLIRAGMRSISLAVDKGFELIPPFEIVVSRNNLVIDLGTLTDEYEKEISIHTTATSKDGEKTILAGKEVTIVDTVKLDGLTKGTKYQLKGWQMLKEKNAELIIDGKRVENDYTFVADDEEMKVEISYTFNASALGGKNLVTFEELYDLSNPDEPVKVAEHKDIEDDGQTVLITERIIKIHTTATDKDGNKELEAGKDVTIIDTVTLEGLEVGTQYKLVGWQMLKEESAELLINGKRVESDYMFTADSETMKVEVAFIFDATSLDGKQLVTFEELYDLSNPDEPKKVTEHKDIEDKGQTITFKEKPEEPEKPETPPTPEKPNRPSDSPKTGDSTNVMAFVVMLLASAGGLAGTYLYKRRKMKKS